MRRRKNPELTKNIKNLQQMDASEITPTVFSYMVYAQVFDDLAMKHGIHGQKREDVNKIVFESLFQTRPDGIKSQLLENNILKEWWRLTGSKEKKKQVVKKVYTGINQEYYPLYEAIQVLADNDPDFAGEKNDVGFNAPDTHPGHRLASKPFESWDSGDLHEAWERLKKYLTGSGQLVGMFDYESIPEPPKPLIHESKQARSATLKSSKNIIGVYTPETGYRKGQKGFLVKFQGGSRRDFRNKLDAVKNISGRTFLADEGKNWWIPFDQKDELVYLSQQFGLDWTDEAEQIDPEKEAEQHREKKKKERESAVIARRRNVLIEEVGGYTLLQFAFDYDFSDPADREMKDELKDAYFHTSLDYTNRRKFGRPTFTKEPFPHWGVKLEKPTDKVDDFIAGMLAAISFCKDYEFKGVEQLEEKLKEVTDNLDKIADEVQEKIDASKAEDAEIDPSLTEGLGLTLRPYQRAGVKYAIDAKKTFIGDEAGVGKTPQAIATLHVLKSFPAIICVPASVKYQWLEELNKWVPDKSILYLAGSDDNKRMKERIKNLGADILQATKKEMKDVKLVQYLNHDIILMHYQQLLLHRNNLINLKPQAIVFDESQMLKDRKTKRTQTAKDIALSADIPIRLLLTGTAYENKTVELTSQLEILGKLEDFGGWKEFVTKFSNAHYKRGKGGRKFLDVTGASNLKELNTALRACCYIRREKTDVLKDLPPKNYYTVPISITNRKIYNEAEDNIIRFLSSHSDTYGDNAAAEALKAKALVEYARLRDLAAKGKIKGSIEWLQSFLTDHEDEKVIIVGWHNEILDKIAEAFDAKDMMVKGGINKEKRVQAIEKLNTDPTKRVFIINVRAGGTGLNLQSANNVVFVEYPWTPGALDQAESRSWRSGQKKNVNIYYLAAIETIDEKLIKLLDAKRKIVSAGLTGKEDDLSITKMLQESVESMLHEEMLMKAGTGVQSEDIPFAEKRTQNPGDLGFVSLGLLRGMYWMVI